MVDRDLIFDIGMADGADTLFYLSKGFRVVAVEADPASAARGRTAFAAEIAAGRLRIVDKAVSDRPGRQTFYANTRQPNWGSLRPGWGGTGPDAVVPVEVETVTLPGLFAEYGVPYFLKIDIEGYDAEALAPLADCDEPPTYVSAELHFPEALTSLANAGYRSFKLVNQTMLWKVRLPDPPREGRLFQPHDWRGASGPFGRETPGREWLSMADATTFLDMFRRLRTAQDFLVSGWIDVHARLDPPGPDNR